MRQRKNRKNVAPVYYYKNETKFWNKQKKKQIKRKIIQRTKCLTGIILQTDPNTRHLKSGNIWKPSFYSAGFWMSKMSEIRCCSPVFEHTKKFGCKFLDATMHHLTLVHAITIWNLDFVFGLWLYFEIKCQFLPK